MTISMNGLDVAFRISTTHDRVRLLGIEHGGGKAGTEASGCSSWLAAADGIRQNARHIPRSPNKFDPDSIPQLDSRRLRMLHRTF
ncbi:hypothetical protein [Lichenihabitans psoromatis]|uniref:hypothetical protein n=1 Tax=Lichenihabitans psoromatis TaxID=2528642 RepID=UPI001035B155|nr:hypothetical protein [Lichenihabitans psoromatis]